MRNSPGVDPAAALEHSVGHPDGAVLQPPSVCEAAGTRRTKAHKGVQRRTKAFFTKALKVSQRRTLLVATQGHWASCCAANIALTRLCYKATRSLPAAKALVLRCCPRLKTPGRGTELQREDAGCR